MIAQTVDPLRAKLDCEQQEVGNVFDVPFGQCRKYGGWLQLLRTNRCDERAVHFAPFHLIQNEFANRAVVMDARTYYVRIQ